MDAQEHSIHCAPQMKVSPTVLVWGGITATGLTKLHIMDKKCTVKK